MCFGTIKKSDPDIYQTPVIPTYPNNNLKYLVKPPIIQTVKFCNLIKRKQCGA